MRHCIFIFSDYISGERIGYHIQNSDGQAIIDQMSKLEEKLKKENPGLKYGVYFLQTEEKGWENVVRTDNFFEGVVVKTKNDFLKAIEKNKFLKNDEDINIKGTLNSSENNNILGKISLISRKENLDLEKYGIKNFEKLEDLESLKEEMKKEIIKKEIVLQNIQTLLKLHGIYEEVHSKKINKRIYLMKLHTKLQIEKVKKRKLNDIYVYALQLDTLNQIIKMYTTIVENFSNNKTFNKIQEGLNFFESRKKK